MRRDLFSSRLLNSKIDSENTTRGEQMLGYFLGPCLVYVMYTGIAGTYLTQFYTDVLGLAGGFMTLMPLVSKLLSSIISFVIGRMIDCTHTAQGKARPWILVSGVLLAVCGILLYCVPKASYRVQIAWVVVSYNLFFSLAFAVYSLSHSLMVPLSTRNTKQRDSLAMLTSTGTSMIPGMLATIIMPLLVSKIGVGIDAQNSWLAVMSILSIIAIPATLVEYYFTKERVTFDSSMSDTQRNSFPFSKQVSACLHDRYWVMIIAFTLILHLCNGLSSNSMLYYCNWVLGNSVADGATKQIAVNVIGQFPMGIGVIILWPLVRRYGKRKIVLLGFCIAAVGSLMVLLAGNNLIAVLLALFIKSVGSLPTYVSAALIAEALDHVELHSGLRADGFTASVNSIILTVVAGISQTILLSGINFLGYVSPQSTTQILSQSDAVKTFFRWCFAGAPMIGYILCACLILFYDVKSTS